MLGNKPFYPRHHDDEGVDEITIRVVPRYKTSGMSGDEWRISAHVQFKRKGELLHETSFSKMSAACALLYAEFLRAGDDGVLAIKDDGKCMQPGCAALAVSDYQFKQDYCSSCGQGRPPSMNLHAQFCQKHLTRGDCALHDADSNYTVISGPGPDDTDWSNATIREAARVEVHVDSVEDIQTKVHDVVKHLKG